MSKGSIIMILKISNDNICSGQKVYSVEKKGINDIKYNIKGRIYLCASINLLKVLFIIFPPHIRNYFSNYTIKLIVTSSPNEYSYYYRIVLGKKFK